MRHPSPTLLPAALHQNQVLHGIQGATALLMQQRVWLETPKVAAAPLSLHATSTESKHSSWTWASKLVPGILVLSALMLNGAIKTTGHFEERTIWMYVSLIYLLWKKINGSSADFSDLHNSRCVSITPKTAQNLNIPTYCNCNKFLEIYLLFGEKL